MDALITAASEFPWMPTAIVACVLALAAAALAAAARLRPAVPLLGSEFWVECQVLPTPPGGMLPGEWAFVVYDVGPRGRMWARLGREGESVIDAFLDFRADSHSGGQFLHVRAYTWGGEGWNLADAYALSHDLRDNVDAAMSRSWTIPRPEAQGGAAGSR